MTQITIPGSRAGAAILRATRALWPALEDELLGRSAKVAFSYILANQRIDTDTLRSSTNVSPGEPIGRGLAYGPGNSPLPITVVDQALSARRFGERLVISEDARSPEGFPYGVVIEARFGTFRDAQRDVRRHAVQIAREAAAVARQKMREAVA